MRGSCYTSRPAAFPARPRTSNATPRTSSRPSAKLNTLYAKHCGRTYEEVERTLDRDNFMSAEEAKAWGLVDHVYGSREESDPT